MSLFKVVTLSFTILLVGCSSFSSSEQPKGRVDQSALAAYTKLGMQYLQAGDTPSAKESLQQAALADPGYAPALNGLAMVFQAEREPELADQYFQRATQADPNSAMIFNNYGAFLFSQRRFEEACKALARSTEDPFYTRRAQAFENLGRCYRLIDRDAAAEHVFNRSVTLSPQRVTAHIELADLYLDNGQASLAAQHYAIFQQQLDAQETQHFAKSLWVGVRLARHSGNPSKAASYALLLKNLYPNSEEYNKFKDTGL